MGDMDGRWLSMWVCLVGVQYRWADETHLYLCVCGCACLYVCRWVVCVLVAISAVLCRSSTS